VNFEYSSYSLSFLLRKSYQNNIVFRKNKAMNHFDSWLYFYLLVYLRQIHSFILIVALTHFSIVAF